MTIFRGLVAFPLTPADERGSILDGVLASHLERIVRAGPQAICLMGSTGAFAYLSLEQRRRALELAVEVVGTRIPLVVGVSALDTNTSVDLATHAMEWGAGGLLLTPMSYTPLTEEEVLGHFSTVSGVVDIPVCIYNDPETTRFSLSFKLVAKLAELPNITAIKMPLPLGDDFRGEMDRLRDTTPRGFSVGHSGDWGAAHALLAGVDAWYGVTAGLLPVQALALSEAARAGDLATARAQGDKLRPLWELFRRFGSLRVMYAMSGLLGLGDIQPPRPLLQLPADGYLSLSAALESVLSSSR